MASVEIYVLDNYSSYCMGEAEESIDSMQTYILEYKSLM